MDQEQTTVADVIFEEVNTIFDWYADRSEYYQRGYNDAMDGGNTCPYTDEAQASDWTKGHRDGVLVQRFLEGEFD